MRSATGHPRDLSFLALSWCMTSALGCACANQQNEPDASLDSAAEDSFDVGVQPDVDAICSSTLHEMWALFGRCAGWPDTFIAAGIDGMGCDLTAGALRESWARGAITIDTEALSRCQMRWMGPCDPTILEQASVLYGPLSPLDALLSCHAISPQVPIGGACGGYLDECLGGSCLRTASACLGTCVPRAQLNDDCSETACSDHLFCARSAVGSRCVSDAEVPCATDVDCFDLTRSDSEQRACSRSGTCVFATAAGQPCSDDVPCAWGLGCNAVHGATAVCVPQGSLGAACVPAPADDCDSDHYCSGGSRDAMGNVTTAWIGCVERHA